MSLYVQTLYFLYIQEGIVYITIKGRHITNVQMHYNAWTDCTSATFINFIRFLLHKDGLDVSLFFTVRQSGKLSDPWRRRPYVSLKHWTPLTEWKIVTSQKTSPESCVTLEEEGATCLWNTGHHWLNGRLSHHGRPESSSSTDLQLL
jgi:hypothetical protein